MRRSLMSALMASAARPLEAASRSRAAWKHQRIELLWQRGASRRKSCFAGAERHRHMHWQVGS
jgi:hypothetical protein